MKLEFVPIAPAAVTKEKIIIDGDELGEMELITEEYGEDKGKPVYRAYMRFGGHGMSAIARGKRKEDAVMACIAKAKVQADKVILQITDLQGKLAGLS